MRRAGCTKGLRISNLEDMSFIEGDGSKGRRARKELWVPPFGDSNGTEERSERTVDCCSRLLSTYSSTLGEMRERKSREAYGDDGKALHRASAAPAGLPFVFIRSSSFFHPASPSVRSVPLYVTSFPFVPLRSRKNSLKPFLDCGYARSFALLGPLYARYT